jgi:hypothetical protein
MNAAELVLLLQNASQGLLYTSESDYPYEVICWEKPESLTEDWLLQKANFPPDSPIDCFNLDDFCDPDAPDPDWYGEEEKAQSARFSYLMNAIADNLENVKVYRIGKTAIQIYILGQLGQQVIGLKTIAIET